ncbi:hypothetical protein LY76DRAFT_277722 [Colletotrichum caudatum]|nr:hypothetical protein LY76DRAFT_277722 [Colletotrichum caudatum]
MKGRNHTPNVYPVFRFDPREERKTDQRLLCRLNIVAKQWRMSDDGTGNERQWEGHFGSDVPRGLPSSPASRKASSRETAVRTASGILSGPRCFSGSSRPIVRQCLAERSKPSPLPSLHSWRDFVGRKKKKKGTSFAGMAGLSQTPAGDRRTIGRGPRASYDRPQDSKSRIMTAIWARFAASATRVKSRRKASVDGAAWPVAWGGGTNWFVDMCEEDEDTEEVESWRLGD